MMLVRRSGSKVAACKYRVPRPRSIAAASSAGNWSSIAQPSTLTDPRMVSIVDGASATPVYSLCSRPACLTSYS